MSEGGVMTTIPKIQAILERRKTLHAWTERIKVRSPKTGAVYWLDVTRVVECIR